MRIQVFQHVPFEGPGMIADWARARGYEFSVCGLYEGGSLPSLDDYEALIVMGGPMSVHDEAQFPWMIAEKAHLRAALSADRPLLGVCLGAQLLAQALGAAVRPNGEREIGWFPVAWTDDGLSQPLLAGLNSAMNVLHWHGERFDIPAGALHLAASEACANQAFLWGDRVLGLQFHLEIDRPALEALIQACPDDLSAGTYVQGAATLLKNALRLPTREVLERLLDNWVATWRC